MKQVKYLIGRIIHLDYKNMIKIAKNISKKINKNYLIILLDMVICGIKYQAGYYDYQEFEFYNLNSKERKTYLTRGKNNEIVRVYNDKSKFHIFENKDEFYTTFDKFIKRKWIKTDGSTKKEFINFFRKNGEIIIKPIDGEGGKGVEKLKYSEEDTETIYNRIKDKKYIAEQCIKQN